MDCNNETLPTEFQLVISGTLRRLLADSRQQLLTDIRQLLSDKKSPPEKQWLKSSEVRKLLGVSHGTLQTLRNKGTIPFTKVGGTIYYSREEINKMLLKRNPFFT